MAKSIDARITDLESKFAPQKAQSFEVRNERDEVIYRSEYNPETGKWIRTVERPDLRTHSEYWYSSGVLTRQLDAISILDL